MDVLTYNGCPGIPGKCLLIQRAEQSMTSAFLLESPVAGWRGYYAGFEKVTLTPPGRPKKLKSFIEHFYGG